MHVQVLTLRYDAARGGFDDGPLVALAERRRVLSVSEHFFRVQEIPHLACVVRWQEERSEPAAPNQPSLVEQAEAPRARSRRARASPPIELPEEARPTFERLRAWRRERARSEGLPAFALLTDRQIAALALRRPSSAEGLAAIDGLGAGKTRWLGEELLALLRQDGPLAAASAP